MSFAPVSAKRKLSLVSPGAPNFQDFSGPPNGDYVRYVDGLMAWAAQEQERARLKALGDKARAAPDAQWGRQGTAASRSTQRAADEVVSAVQSGGVESSMDRLQRKAKAQARTWQPQKQSAIHNAGKAKDTATAPFSLVSMRNASVLAVIVGLVLLGIFAAPLLPIAIIAWVVFNVFRAVRAASSAGNS